MRTLLAGVVALVLLGGCSDTRNEASADVEMTVELSPLQTDARRFDADDEATTGAIVLEGTASSPEGDVGVVVWGLFNYRNDVGEFAAAVEFDFGAGNKLYAHGNAGTTTLIDGGAHVEADLRIVGGTGTYEGRRGTATYSADRDVTVGSPLVATLRVWFDDESS
ncbi:MAG: hypothetical protein ACO3C1_12515 [Ilumatobacteraceae bacterium]